MAADTHTDTSQSYTVVLRGEAFQLSHSQIYFDSPNYLTTCFSSGFAESRNRTLRLDRSPALFAIIVDYLSGYTVLPISPRAIPPTMTEATALDNLLADARFYDLQGLQDLIFSTKRCVGDLTWMGLANETVSLRDVLAHELPHGVVERDDGSVVSTDGLPVLVSARDMLATCVPSSMSRVMT
ncbi:hypothetical protein K466DRAFT_496484 [Polyporus arcularius HHB13444]|uniref:BTB domain-containing protein n=1 Tax=Polyporus arcularius HHB13444 TaxID=1314778 RepID=A0A5C3P4U2_9APHY|nr:hypothetical protein K466DRAFT_496484 [Polyporus arcularius HHB13444]